MEFVATRMALGFAFLAVAAAMDWRSRLVKDAVWVVLGAFALGLVEFELVRGGAPWSLHLVPAATAILYFGVFYGTPMWSEGGFRVHPVRFLAYLSVPLLIVLAWRSAEDLEALGGFYRLLTMPGMIVVAHGMYYVNVLRGGADAKAVMALSLLFPGIYPRLGPFPLLAPSPVLESVLAVWFPFAFIVIVNAALLLLGLPLLFLARNAAAREARLPRALLGYRVPIDDVPKFAWLMDRVERGQVVTVYFPRHPDDREDQLRLLRARGLDRVWVTPQLPFVTAILVGYGLAIVLGNPLLAPFAGAP